MPPVNRRATHCGSWYSAYPSRLDAQLTDLLKRAPGPFPGARILIGPHAGYSYCGSTLAQTYKAWDTSKVRRVFIIGPSHLVYFKNYAYVSYADSYDTPFGPLFVDKEVVNKLVTHSLFKPMSIPIDEDEHSFEMHAPFIYKIGRRLVQGAPKIIPIMISHGSHDFDDAIASVLSEYLKDEENTFVISSDFCHWGPRFGYTEYTATGSIDDLIDLDAKYQIEAGSLPIHKSIEFLDKTAAKIASTGSSADWDAYIKKTGNTICGEKPVSILLKAIEGVRKEDNHYDDWARFKWIGYAQSSRVTEPSDSSVSYYSGYAIT